MLTLGMTAGAEKDVIWVYKIDMDGSYLYFSTEWDKITLDGTDFDGKVMFKDSMGQMEEGIVGDGINGGNISIVSNHSFSIARYNNYTGTSNFFNDFYPQTSKPLLVAKDVHVGVCWRGATTLAEITWIKKYKAQEVKTFFNKMDIYCIEEDELSAVELPYHTIQEDKDNGISYFPDLDKESYGTIIPILYGTFVNPTFADDIIYSEYSVVPAFRIDKSKYKFIVCSHICSVYFYSLYQYVDSINTVMRIYDKDNTYLYSNTRAGGWVQLGDGKLAIYGEVFIQPKAYINDASFAEIGVDAYDDDPDSSAQVAVNSTVGFMLGTDASTNEIGYNSGVRNDIEFAVDWASTNGSAQNIDVIYYHPGSIQGSIAGYSSLVASDSTTARKTTNYYMGDGNYNYGSNPCKWEDAPQWAIEELQFIYFTVKNKSTSSAPIQIYNCYLRMSNITVFTKLNKTIQLTIPQPRIIKLPFQVRMT